MSEMTREDILRRRLEDIWRTSGAFMARVVLDSLPQDARQAGIELGDARRAIRLMLDEQQWRQKTEEEVIKAAVSVITEPILQLLQDDPHSWSTRPCSTCRTVGSLTGKPFGCYLYAQQERKV